MAHILIDTHVVIWALQYSKRLGSVAAGLLTSPEHTNYISAVSSWEIAQLRWKKRLGLPVSAKFIIDNAREALQAVDIDLDHKCAIEAYNLPGTFHDDPADRMLVATARRHELQLMTADKRLIRYRGVKTINAEK